MWPFEKKRRRGRPKNKNKSGPLKVYSKDEKLKLLREFGKVGAPITMFCKWYGVSVGTFKSWQDKLKTQGEDGLEDNRTGRIPQEVPEAVKQEIINIKMQNPGFGVKKIGDLLARNKFVKIGRDKVEKVLKDDPKTAELVQKKRTIYGNAGKEPQRFERSKPGDLYQMDIMTFHLRGLYKVYVIACLDDYSRFVVSIGIFRNQTADKAIDVLKSAVEKYGMPKEVLTDNGRQFYTWRGRSEFQKYLQKSGIRHIRSRPYHPQTCGKVESLWRNMYQELLSKEPIATFEEMQEKVGKWVEWYNYKRPHQGIGSLVPSDRFFNVENGVKEMMQKGSEMVKESLLSDPRKIKEPTYLVGKIGGKEIRVIAKEGSVTLEGIDGVEKTQITTEEEENKNGRADNNTGTGIEENIQGNTEGREIQSGADGIGEEEKREADNGGNGDIQAGVPGVEEDSDGIHSESVPGGKETGKEAQGLCSGGQAEGKCRGDEGKGIDAGAESPPAGSGKGKSAEGTDDGAPGPGLL